MRPSSRNLLFLVASFLTLRSPTISLADDWPSPQTREIFSQARDHFVRIIPGESWGDSYGFAGAPKGPYAKAEFYHRRDDGSYGRGATVTLVNPVAPIDCFVNGHGALFMLDNWHNMGFGKIFAVYAPDGSLVKSYDLNELFSKEEIAGFEHSESSIWWRKGPAYVQKDQTSLYVTLDGKGSSLTFDAETGAYQFCEWHAREFVCRSSNSDRHWQPYKTKV